MLHLLTRWVWEKKRNTAGPEWEECKFKQPHPFPNVFLAVLGDFLDIFSSRFLLQKLIIPNLIFIIEKWTENCCQPAHFTAAENALVFKMKRKRKKDPVRSPKKENLSTILKFEDAKSCKENIFSSISCFSSSSRFFFLHKYLLIDKCFIT